MLREVCLVKKEEFKSETKPKEKTLWTTISIAKVSGLKGRTPGDVKSSMKETVNANGDHLVEDIGTGDGAGDMRGGHDEKRHKRYGTASSSKNI